MSTKTPKSCIRQSPVKNLQQQGPYIARQNLPNLSSVSLIRSFCVEGDFVSTFKNIQETTSFEVQSGL